MSRLIDFIFGLLKWPVALVALVSLPALIQVFSYFQLNNMKFFMFLGGIGAYLLIKILASARVNMSMQILVHEFTHTFFALLTFHRIVHIHLNMNETGGSMGFKGKGNWLIVIGPYFFPLVLFFMMIGLTIWSDKFSNNLFINGLLGYFFAYHIETIMIQIHPEQPDFKIVGFPFCWIFLPSANLFVGLIVLAFNNGGWLAVQRLLNAIYKLDLHNVYWLLDYFTK